MLCIIPQAAGMSRHQDQKEQPSILKLKLQLLNMVEILPKINILSSLPTEKTEEFKVVIATEMIHFHQKDRRLLMTNNTKLVFNLLEKNASSERPTNITCDTNEILQQSGLSVANFNKAINELREQGIIKTVLGNNIVADIELLRTN